jgi:hypothetical protein
MAHDMVYDLLSDECGKTYSEAVFPETSAISPNADS